MMRLTWLHPHRVARARGGSDPARASTRAGVDDEVGTRLGEQLGEAGDGEVDRVRVDAALEPRRRVAAQSGAGDAGRDAERLEPRDLEADGGGARRRSRCRHRP